MSSIIIKVPTKITIFGEHAVVYGVPAIASTIPVYIGIEGRLIPSEVISVTLRHKLTIPVDTITIYRNEERVQLQSEETIVRKVMSYVLTAINVCEKEIGITGNKGYSLIIDSPLPPGVGLGTSAAISVGTITSCFVLHGYIKSLSLEEYRQSIAKMAWTVEKIVQGAASPMDTYTIALGGLKYIEPTIPIAESIDIDYQLPVIIGYTNRKDTTAELVRRVRKLKERNEDLFNEILNIIRDVVKNAREALLNHDLEMLGMLMNLNHGILQSLGLVDSTHDIVLHALRNAGALGAKTSGAGSGGAFLALARSVNDLNKLAAVAESLGAKVVSKGLCRDGILLI